jgi:hypothetical protein
LLERSKNLATGECVGKLLNCPFQRLVIKCKKKFFANAVVALAVVDVENFISK